MRMVRRSFISLHRGHLDLHDKDEDPEVEMRGYFNLLKQFDWKSLGFTGVALALERGTQTDRIHIQGYCEHSQMRFSTLGKKFSASPTAFSVVRDSRGAYDYCTGSGVHADKEGVLDRFVFGTFKLHGDTQKADLKMMVDLVLQGAKPHDLIRHYPYAWCVHRDRLMKFFDDLRNFERFRTKPEDMIGAEDTTRPPDT
jgi:hypothetical protein